MNIPQSSPGPERRLVHDRRRDSKISLYDRLDETIRKIEAERRRTARRRRDDESEASGDQTQPAISGVPPRDDP